MNGSIGRLAARFDTLSARERWMIALALAVLLAQGGGELVVRAHEGLEQARDMLAQHRDTLTRLVETTDDAAARLRERAGEGPQRRIAALRQRIEASERARERLARSLIAPREMTRLLRELLDTDDDLELLALEKLGSRPLEPDHGESATTLYAHDVRIELRGGYGALLRYIERLEGLSGGLVLDELELLGEEAPRHRARIRLHTLGLTEDWIGV